MVFVVDTKKEINAVREARKLRIPIIGLIDTNADPDEVDYPIASNDDAMRAIALFCRMVADACLEGRSSRNEGAESPAAAEEMAGGKESVA